MGWYNGSDCGLNEPTRRSRPIYPALGFNGVGGGGGGGGTYLGVGIMLNHHGCG